MRIVMKERATAEVPLETSSQRSSERRAKRLGKLGSSVRVLPEPARMDFSNFRAKTRDFSGTRAHGSARPRLSDADSLRN